MVRTEKNEETRQRIAMHWKKVGTREWAIAEKTGVEHHYQKARMAFERATRIAIRNV